MHNTVKIPNGVKIHIIVAAHVVVIVVLVHIFGLGTFIHDLASGKP